MEAPVGCVGTCVGVNGKYPAGCGKVLATQIPSKACGPGGWGELAAGELQPCNQAMGGCECERAESDTHASEVVKWERNEAREFAQDIEYAGAGPVDVATRVHLGKVR